MGSWYPRVDFERSGVRSKIVVISLGGFSIQTETTNTRHYALCFAAAAWLLNSFEPSRLEAQRDLKQKVLYMSVAKSASKAKTGWNEL